MTDTNDHPLKHVSRRILENWAMMIADEVPESNCHFDESEKLFMAWVNIHGHIRGALSIVAQANFIEALASNLLGSAPDCPPSPEECEDALREMSNVLAGNFFTEAYGEKVVFDLINPNVTEVPFAELKRISARKIKYFFVADDTPVVVTFSTKE